MKRLWLSLILVTGLVWSGGCKKPVAAEPPSVPAISAPTQAQPKLQTIRLWLGTNELITELALAPREQEMGMMFRTNMAENEAMLFPFATPRRASFWMRNTLLPLSCAFIDSDGVILETRDMKPRDETPITASSEKVLYVLETTQGWFERNGVSAGAVVRSERGSLGETFFGKN